MLPKKPRRKQRTNPGTLYQLDQFSENDVKGWEHAFESFESYWIPVHYYLEAQRQLHQDAITEALKKSTPVSINMKGWCRIVDYQYSDNPLSARGSLISGGRFNIGSEAADDVLKPLSVLYCAENYKTAYAERFGVSDRSDTTTLSGEELALRKTGSFSNVELKGTFYNLFDLNKTSNLTPFVNIIKKFDISPELKKKAKELGISAPYIIDKPSQVKKVFLDPSWRQWLTFYDIPSNSQVFGRLLSVAGFDGVLYPSTKGPNKCVAIFLSNLVSSDSFIEIADPSPSSVKFTRLDKNTWQDLQ